MIIDLADQGMPTPKGCHSPYELCHPFGIWSVVHLYLLSFHPFGIDLRNFLIPPSQIFEIQTGSVPSGIFAHSARGRPPERWTVGAQIPARLR